MTTYTETTTTFEDLMSEVHEATDYYRGIDHGMASELFGFLYVSSDLISSLQDLWGLRSWPRGDRAEDRGKLYIDDDLMNVHNGINFLYFSISVNLFGPDSLAL